MAKTSPPAAGSAAGSGASSPAGAAARAGGGSGAASSENESEAEALRSPASRDSPLLSPVRLAGVGTEAAREGRAQQRYRQDGARLVTGCVPYHRDAASGELQVLLISSHSRSQWIIPKGGWERDESEAQAAVRESYEEAGVRGRIGPKLCTYTHTGKLGQQQSHAYYALEVDEVLTEWPDCQNRRRCWVKIEQAAVLCTRKGMHDAIVRLMQMYGLGSGGGGRRGGGGGGVGGGGGGVRTPTDILSPTVLADESPPDGDLALDAQDHERERWRGAEAEEAEEDAEAEAADVDGEEGGDELQMDGENGAHDREQGRRGGRHVLEAGAVPLGRFY